MATVGCPPLLDDTKCDEVFVFQVVGGGHLYRPTDITPPVRCDLNGIPLHCPHRPHDVLMQEYRNYKSTVYHKWRF